MFWEKYSNNPFHANLNITFLYKPGFIINPEIISLTKYSNFLHNTNEGPVGVYTLGKTIEIANSFFVFQNKK